MPSWTAPRIQFRFRGKSGKDHELGLRDRRLARLIRRCQELPGQELFAYLDADGSPHQVRSEDVNDYLRRISGAELTARDFRTWAGTLLAMRELRRSGPPDTGVSASSRQVAGALDAVAQQLGNTRSVLRASYVHPIVFDAWRVGDLRPIRRSPEVQEPATRAEELQLIRLLEPAPAG